MRRRDNSELKIPTFRDERGGGVKKPEIEKQCVELSRGLLAQICPFLRVSLEQIQFENSEETAGNHAIYHILGFFKHSRHIQWDS